MAARMERAVMDPNYVPPSTSLDPNAVLGGSRIVSDKPVEVDTEAPPPPPPPPGGEVQADVAADVVAKLNAGMRLFFAIYHSPHATEIINAAAGPDGKTRGVVDAYMAATRAFLQR